MPAMPPPTTITSGCTFTSRVSSAWWRLTRWIAAAARVLALRVASSSSTVTQETCSRTEAIWKKYGLTPARRQAAWKVFSCSRGEHDATTTRFKPWTLMSFSIISWPGSEHMNL